MATFRDIGGQYAGKIRAAIAKDGLTKTASLSASSLRGTHVVSALREIAASLDKDWTIDGRPLTEEEKRAIAKEAGLALGLLQPEEFHLSVRAASNDEYAELVEHISNILRNK
jgi:hypothetical protein